MKILITEVCVSDFLLYSLPNSIPVTRVVHLGSRVSSALPLGTKRSYSYIDVCLSLGPEPCSAVQLFITTRSIMDSQLV